MMRYHQSNPVIVTLPESYPNEARAIFALVENGAGIIHVRKPGWDEGQMCEYLKKLHPEILYHITLHYFPHLPGYFGLGGVHLKAEEVGRTTGSFRKSISCHNWSEVKACMGHVDYAFLSPVFDSLSKAGYTSGFTGEQLRILLQDPDRPVVVALGGITAENILRTREWGFEGAAALGSIWAVRDGRIDIPATVNNYKALEKAWNGTK